MLLSNCSHSQSPCPGFFQPFGPLTGHFPLRLFPQKEAHRPKGKPVGDHGQGEGRHASAKERVAESAAGQHYKVKHLLMRDSGTMLSRTMNEYWDNGWRFLFMTSHEDDLYLTFERREDA